MTGGRLVAPGPAVALVGEEEYNIRRVWRRFERAVEAHRVMSDTKRRVCFWMLVAVGAALPLLGGCQGAIVGHWYVVKALPNRDTFNIDDVTFRKDGTYAATRTDEGITRRENGTYTFVGYQLKIRPEDGGQRKYTTFLKMNTLEVRDGEKMLVLKKGERGG